MKVTKKSQLPVRQEEREDEIKLYVEANMYHTDVK